MKPQCVACEKSGLPIVFLFHGAIANDKSFAPSEAFDLSKLGFEPPSPINASLQAPARPEQHDQSVKAIGLPALTHSRYVLRSLRPGVFLYVYHEKPSEALKLRARNFNKGRTNPDPEEANWEVFRVLKGGAIVPREHPYFANPQPFACFSDNGTHIFTTMTYRLGDAHLAAGIRVAVSANLWDSKLRKKNKESMLRISIPDVLAGTPPGIIRPDAAWLERYVADFALDNLKHAGKEPTSALAPLKGRGAELCKRMALLSKGHPKVEGKGFVVALADPVGTAEALADISRARHLQALDYSNSQRHPLGAAAGIEFVRKCVYDERAASLPNRPLVPTDAYNARGEPLFSPEGAKQMPDEREMRDWVHCGVMTYTTYVDRRRPPRSLPESARFLQLKGDYLGVVIAPKIDVATVHGEIATRKMRRLHNEAALKTFLAKFENDIKGYNRRVSEHDSDRAKVLVWAKLKAVMRDHFDKADPNATNQPHSPGLVYMQEVAKALIAGGEGMTPGLEHAAKVLLNAKVDSDDGWALRGMIANQEGLFSPLATFMEDQFDWYSSEDKKLDKTYDTLKALLCDDISGKVTARHGWLNLAGVGFSYQIQGFLVGAAVYLVGKELEEWAAKNAASVKQAAQSAKAAVSTASASTAKMLDSAQNRLATKLNAWCHQQALIIDGVLNKKPAARPVMARVEVTIEQALEVLSDRRAPGSRMGQREAAWRSLPEHLRGEKVQLDWITTDVDLQDVRNVQDLDAKSSKVVVKVRDHHRGLLPVEFTMEQLNELYRRAHRYDGLKKSIHSAVRDGIPATAQALMTAVVVPTKAVLQGASTATAPGGVVSKVAGGAGTVAKSLTSNAGMLSLFGAWLQWRLHEQNKEKIEALTARLANTPHLTWEQREAIQDTILLTRLGLWDNYAGIAGGVLEATGLVAAKLRLVTPGAGLLAGAAFAGAAGNFANAFQNFAKARTKADEGAGGFSFAYRGVGALYAAAALALVASGVEIGVHWYLERKVLEVGLRQVGVAVASRFGYGLALRGLSLTGWGVVLTLAAFAIEGIVVYFDRTELEQWIENCYFGVEPKYRGTYDDPALWTAEAKALEMALKKASESMAANEKLAVPARTPTDGAAKPALAQ